MLPIKTTLLALLAATGITAEHLRVIFSAGGFSSIGGTGNYDGFVIMNDAGDAIYNHSAPADHSPCYNTDEGRTFTIEGDCWDTPRTFHCLSDFAARPESCDVSDVDGNILGTGVGQRSTTFAGITIGIDASCVVEFDSLTSE
ncbi:hypothetical protein BJX70DRAFT_397244 [Aspergillus crustosus]